MNNRGSARWAILMVGIAAASLRCTDRDVSRLIGTNSLAPSADAGLVAGCVPGQTLACMGACGGELSLGYQVCADDGRSYGECVCPAPGERPFISIDPNSVLLSPEAVPVIRLPEPVPSDDMTPAAERGIVGAACEDNADCQGSLGCLTSSSTLLAGGGVAGGYCTAECTDNDYCRSIDPLSACGRLGGQDMCIKLCLAQTPEEGEVKCMSRPDLTCVSLAALQDVTPTPGERQIGICAPQCQSDAGCDGRVCDLARGVCTDTPRPGAPIGSGCELGEDCAGGACIGLAQTASFCSAFCTLGVAGCGYSSEETAEAACLLTQIQGEGAGDRGLCMEICEAPSDCLQPGSQCVPFEASPRGGVCVRPEGPVIIDPDPPQNEPDAGSGEPGIVGANCEADSDCSGGLGCITADSTEVDGGGIAGGYCTLSCTSSDDCTSIDPSSACGSLGGERVCIRLCLSQAPEEDEPKCLLRSDLTCLSFALLGLEEPTGERQFGICVPQCQSDEGCGDRFCDLSRGICVDTPPSGGPIGSDCDEPEECAGGVCLGLGPNFHSFCSAFCRLGAAGCGFGEEETPGAACVFSQVDGEGDGDQGVCFEVCETAADCVEQGAECQPLSESPLGGVCVRSTSVVEPPDTDPPDTDPPDTNPPDNNPPDTDPPDTDPPPDPPVGSEPGIVGAACDTDSDCGGGLGCLTASSTAIAGGGVAGGYCTLSCSGSADCTSIDPASTCGTLGGQAMCIRLCLSQTPEPDEAKCLLRPDLTCVSLAVLGQEPPSGERQLGICAPQCQSDASCGGRFCDLSRGICTDTPPSGAPIGGGCEQAEDCAGGVCLGLGAQFESSCSAFCTLGASGCGFGEGETPGAACVFAQVQGEGTGDQGLCFEVCATAADCVEPGSQCQPLSGSPLGGVCVRSRPPVVVPPDNGPPDNPPPNDEPPVSEPPDNGPPDAGTPDDVTPPDVTPDAGSSEPEPDPVPSAGLACDADDDCPTGTCLTSESNPFGGTEGGPAGGYCSASCGGNAPCEPGALCVPLPGGSRCFLRCSANEETPCHGRDTLICNTSSGAANAFCQPLCNSDADCGDRICANLTNGLCIDAVPCASDLDCETGACDESRGICLQPEPCRLDVECGPERICNTETDTCARAPSVAAGGVCAVDTDCPGDLCLPTDTAGFCSAFCTLGTPFGCELYGTDSFCLIRAAPAPSTLGVCAGLCNVPEDCASSGFQCVSLPRSLNGNTGVCVP